MQKKNVLGLPQALDLFLSDAAFVESEELVGAVDGVNTIYTTAEKFTHIWLYFDGQRLQKTKDYTVSESVVGEGYDTVTTDFAPSNGNITADYVKKN